VAVSTLNGLVKRDTILLRELNNSQHFIVYS